MTYEESLDYLGSLGKFGINLGLSRIKKLLELMHNPERRFRSVHVTGTNGKGSTTAMLTGILLSSGIRTGMYTSPHLTDYTERIVIDGLPVSQSEFAKAISHTAKFVKLMVEGGLEHPTEFEVLTAAAFYCFAAAGVEYAVVEVGLGGLLDSTNVIVPEIAVITNVTLEHTDRCGKTVSEIAQHKAGIIKNGVPVVTGARQDALEVIKNKAAELNAPVFIYGRDFCGKLGGVKDWQQQVAISIPQDDCYGHFSINLIGKHQVENCATAVMCATILAEKNKTITADSIKKGLAATKWPGRFEVIEGRPLIVIDGAHNPDGAARLRDNLDLLFPGKDIVFLLGILKDKDVSGIVSNMIKPSDTVVVTAPESYRAGDPCEVAKKINAKHVSTADSIETGIDIAKSLAGIDGIVCIAGSLYLVGTARQLILSRQK